MPGLNRQVWSVLAVFITLAPNPAPAQPVATSFEELRQVLKPGQTVLVTDSSGQQIKGRVAQLPRSPSSLVLLAPKARTFAEGTVTEIRATDSLLNGALIGGGIGIALATWDYLIDPSEPGNAAIFAVAITGGTAIGAGIDRVIAGGRVLYRSRPQRPSLRISPFAHRDCQGLVVSVRF
jgi:hypothetical protein